MTKNVIKVSIQLNDYREYLFIRSHCHEIYTEEINKIALSFDDDKRVNMADGTHILAYGHINLKKL